MQDQVRLAIEQTFPRPRNCLEVQVETGTRTSIKELPQQAKRCRQRAQITHDDTQPAFLTHRELCGVEANTGKYLAGEFAFEACHTAMLTLGGMGYAQEYHVERLLREVLIPRTAPVTPHMILNFLAEKVLELPRSY
jgi:alkylation response protein AidB-like acyl-CoA dehydrogenase